MKLAESMTIEAIRQPRTDIPGDHIGFKSVLWCCERMGAAWMNLEVTFGNEMFAAINDYAGVRRNYTLGKLGEYGHKINRCPYCNAEIKTVVKEAA